MSAHDNGGPPPVRRFNHACELAFTVISEDLNGEDFTGPMLREAILKRLASIGDAELLEAVGAPFDTFEEQDMSKTTFASAAPKDESAELSDWPEFRERRIALFKLWTGVPLEEVEKARDAYFASDDLPTPPAGGGDDGLLKELLWRCQKANGSVVVTEEQLRRLASHGSAPAPSGWKVGDRVVWNGGQGPRLIGVVESVRDPQPEVRSYFIRFSDGSCASAATDDELSAAPTPEPHGRDE